MLARIDIFYRAPSRIFVLDTFTPFSLNCPHSLTTPVAMTPVLLSPTTPIPRYSTPLNRRTEIPAKFSGRPERNAGGCSELPGIFSGSLELLPRTSHVFRGSSIWDDARRAVSYRVIITTVPGGEEVKNEIVRDASEMTHPGR